MVNKASRNGCPPLLGLTSHTMRRPATESSTGNRASKDSLNTGWHNASFQGFADYMQTPEFRVHLDDLIELAKSERVAIMCAEAVPWRCHRSLIADALLARRIEVREITSALHSRPHKLTPWGKIDGTKVTYPAGHTA